MTQPTFWQRIWNLVHRDRSIGFGLQRLGLVTIRYPRIMALAVLAFTVLAVSQIPRANVDGDLLRVYEDSGEHYDAYRRLTDQFGTFESDVYVLARSERLSDPAVLERMREFAFDLELNDYANGTLSPFSLRRPTEDGGSAPAVPEGMGSAAEVQAALADLQQNDPMMRNLIQPDLKGIVLIMFPNPQMTDERGGTAAMVDSLRELQAKYGSDDIQIELTGQPIWTGDLLSTTVNDQVRFSIYGFGLGALIALVSLRSFWGALIVAATPAMALAWLMGTALLLFGSFSFLTIIVTTLVLVIAFAESMFFIFNWLNYWRDGMDPYRAVDTTIRVVGPASALTMLTTVVSFASLSLTPGKGVQEFSQAGVVASVLLFVCLMTFLPLLLKLAVRLGFKRPERYSVALTAPIPVAWFVASRFGRPLAMLAIVGSILLFIPYFQIQPHFSFQDFVPRGSNAVQAAESIDEGVGGVAPLYVRVPLKEGLEEISDADFALVETVHDTLEKHLGENKAISAASFRHYSDVGFSRQDIFDAVGEFLMRRFVTADGTQAMVTGLMPTLMDSADLKKLVADVEVDFAAQGIDAEIGGLNILTTFGTDSIVTGLQLDLTVSVLVNLLLIGFAFKSLRVSLAAAIPNLFPVLGTEAWLYFTGQGLQLTTVLSLTIAFGIAVDDTTHFLSHYLHSRREEGRDHRDAIKHTLDRIGGAIVATTIILCSGVAIVAFSELPQVALFGALFVITLALALLGDLFILPALLVAGGRFFHPLGGIRK